MDPSRDDPGRHRLVHPASAKRSSLLFVSTYLFYLAIGGFGGSFDAVTGAVSSAVVAVVLSRVTLPAEPTLRRTGGRLLRLVPFVPYLLWEIAKANLAMAYVILHPRLPIDPSTVTYRPGCEGDVERVLLANSITLTPGTLTIDVRDDEFTVHTLTGGTRETLLAGRLERAVAFVARGRDSRRSVRDDRGETDRGPGVDDPEETDRGPGVDDE